MGLVERRAIKKFEEQNYPQLKKRIDTAAGYDVPVEVYWDTLALDDYAHLYQEAFEKVFFLPLLKAVQAVCVDDMGKEALRDGLKKVVIRHSEQRDISFKGGVLTLDLDPVTNIDDVDERRQTVQGALEKGL